MKLGDVEFNDETGWVGVFTRNQAEGALPNGTPIVKRNSEPGDAARDGDKGVVLGSMNSIPEVEAEARAKGVRPPDAFFYSVEWRTRPRHALNVMDWKIARADG